MTVYVPVAVVVALGTVAVEPVELVIETGPVHAYVATLEGLFAVRVSVLPTQIGPLFDALVSVGALLVVSFALFDVATVSAVASVIATV